MNKLLKMKKLVIEGFTDEKWVEIVHGVDLDLHRGEVMGLIGESGAAKSTIGLAAMGRIAMGGSTRFMGTGRSGAFMAIIPSSTGTSLPGGATCSGDGTSPRITRTNVLVNVGASIGGLRVNISYRIAPSP